MKYLISLAIVFSCANCNNSAEEKPNQRDSSSQPPAIDSTKLNTDHTGDGNPKKDSIYPGSKGTLTDSAKKN